ncbi:MAG: phosphatidylserine/phosphatidylglycerophosphate/cardiolipin synthase family protein [Candidatus Bathyarchaeia archaeon]
MPKFWGSWKGRVLKAIVVDKATKWEEIRELTGLSEESLNTALSELFDAHIITKHYDGSYWVEEDTYYEYKDFFDSMKIKQSVPTVQIVAKFPEEKQKDIITWIDQWRKVKGLDFSLEHKHFFLVGRHLDDISNELISRAKSEILVANPFVSSCDLSNTLRAAAKRGIQAILITRPPDEKDKQKYHRYLGRDGVKVTYNEAVHAKLIVLDRAIAVTSSMNFYSGSSGGASWEAGIVSVEQKVVEAVANSILRLSERSESFQLQ